MARVVPVAHVFASMTVLSQFTAQKPESDQMASSLELSPEPPRRPLPDLERPSNPWAQRRPCR